MSAVDRGDMVKKGRFQLWPCHCTLQGEVRLEVVVPSLPPEATSLFLLFPPTTAASSPHPTTSQAHRVPLVRDETSPNIYHATSPGRSTPGPVRVSLCYPNTSGSLTAVSTTQFVYTTADHSHVVEEVLSHVRGGLPLQSEMIPSLESPAGLSELDSVLTVAVQGLERDLQTAVGASQNPRAPRFTLFHLASHHNLMCLAKHLVTLPQAILSLCLHDEQDLTPVDIARDSGNKKMLKILTSTLLQSSSVVASEAPLSGSGAASVSSSMRNSQDELLRFREINEEWRGQIKRHKVSCSSMGSSNFNPETTTASSRDRLSTPPFSGPVPTSTKVTHRRKSIAVMEHRHLMASGCLQLRTEDPELARSERSRKQSWSVVVGEADCRSVDTGLNELDRLIATDRVQQCVTGSTEQGGGANNHLDPTHLNLLSCYSVSCPLLTEDEESGTNSHLTSTRTSPGPDYTPDSSPPPHLPPPPFLSTSISVPEDLSETGVHLHLQRAAQAPPTSSSLSPSPSPVPSCSTVNVPQVITTRYSTENLHDNMVLPPNNERSSGGDCNGTTEEEEDVGLPLLESEMNHDDRGKEDEEEDEEELCQSISAPHLMADSEEESAVNQHSNTRDAPNNHSAVGSNKKVMFGNENSTAHGNGHAAVDRSESNPTGRSRKKSHRRSQSMSVVELSIPTGDVKTVLDTGSDEERKSKRKSARSSTLKPAHSPLTESAQSSDQPSSASASRSSSMKDNRSRASSLLTDASSMHESDDTMSEEDDTMPELSGMSCASLEGGDQDEPAITNTTPLVNESEQQYLRPQMNDLPDGGRTDVVLRGRKGRPRVSQELRYSADVLTAYKDTLEANLGPASRRLNSESIDERKDLGGTGGAYPSNEALVDDGKVDQEKRSIANDSVFDHDVALSDVDVRVQSDDSLSQGKNSPTLSPAHRDTKRRIQRSPFLGRRHHTVRERTPPKPKNKLLRGLTKEDVSPVIGKMRSILNSHEDEPAVEPEPDATSPGGGSTSLDRVPRSPVVKTNGTTMPTQPSFTSQISPLSKAANSAHPSSPLFSPPSPSRQISSPPAINTAPNHQGPVPKSSSEKMLNSSHPPPPRSGKKKPKTKSMSLDQSSPAMKDIISMRNAVAEPLPEEFLEEDEEENKPSGKKDTSKVKLIRDNFIRRSKSRMKAFNILGGGADVEKAITESYSKGSGGTGAVRAKSMKQRPKLNDVFPHQEQSKKSPQHKAKEDKEEEEEKDRKREPPRKLGPEHRRDSDSSLVNSPTHSGVDHSLSVVDESQKGGQRSPDPNNLSPAPPENLSDSDREEVAQQLVRSMSQSHPELELMEETSWTRTIDRRLLRKMNKNERDRQNIIHELIQTERHHYRALHVLKLVFKSQMEKHLSEESLEIMFPQLDNLIEISRSFLDRLEDRRGRDGPNVIIQDISDVLLEEYTADRREKILNTFGEFCTYHLIATEMYKEQLKKKPFGRLVQQLYRIKECQRLYLPDYYTTVSQRLTKMVQFVARLVKKTEVLKLDHAERLRQCQQALESLVTAVDQRVDERKNQMELEEIQDKLEISLPRTAAKNPVLRAMRDLNLVAQNRRLIKRGYTLLIHGHGKQLPVHILLVTDLVVLLTERDQKYNLPAILDLKPPIIRLYDLHVRVNASVRSGIQLLLLEKGSAPEMFRLEFKSKKEAKEWEVTLTQAGDVCREKAIKCGTYS
jgi:hypothetical protein